MVKLPDSSQASNETAKRSQRLTPIDRERDLLPWRHATELTRCFLYWIPVSSFPVPVPQRTWLLEYFRRFSRFLKEAWGLREEVFFQFKAFYDLRKPFVSHQQEFYPILGLSRRPGAGLPEPPSWDEINALGQEVLKTGKPPDGTKYMPDYCYWFANKAAAKQRELFLGHAALTMIFLKPDPKAGPPELPPFLQFLKKRPDVPQEELENMLATAFSFRDGFLPKSKQLFGAGLEDEPQFKGLLYILPLLATGDFFNQAHDEAKKWFELFDVYVNESPADKGILLASKKDLEEPLVELLKGMRDDGFDYPER